MEVARPEDVLEAGTGFMVCLTDAIHDLIEKGYTANFSMMVNHLECCSGEHKLQPSEFEVDKVFRFENTSDPDDQSILYAISSTKNDIKGLYVESYGLYHDEQSPEIIEKFKQHH